MFHVEHVREFGFAFSAKSLMRFNLNASATIGLFSRVPMSGRRPSCSPPRLRPCGRVVEEPAPSPAEGICALLLVELAFNASVPAPYNFPEPASAGGTLGQKISRRISTPTLWDSSRIWADPLRFPKSALAAQPPFFTCSPHVRTTHRCDVATPLRVLTPHVWQSCNSADMFIFCN
jgi:hypothetical protein